MGYSKAPFVKITILFVIGTLISPNIKMPLYNSLLALGLMLIILICSIKIYYQKLNDIIVPLSIVIFGILNFKILDDRVSPLFFAKYDSKYLLLEVHSNVKANKNGVSYYAKVKKRSIGKDNTFINTLGNIYIIYKGKKIPKIGDLFIIRANFNKISEIKVLSGFNKEKILNNNNIYYEQYLSDNNFYKYGESYSLNAIVQRLNNSIQEVFNNSLSYKSASFAKAYILGNKNDLDYDNKNDFSVSGVMHILAVSGLHVGMLYIIINFFTSFLYKNKYQRFIQSAIIISLLIVYAFITNLSPGVFRATLMLVIIIVAKTFWQKINIYNIIFASAFIILCFKPKEIYTISFQLSYSAVLGIVSLRKIFARYIKSKNKILRYIYEIINISLAAQLATCFLSIYYFYKFPTYFLFANMLIIPIAWLTMISLILLLIFAFIPIVNNILILINECLIKGIYYIIAAIAKLPYSSIYIWIDEISIYISYLILLSLIVYLLTKKYKYIVLIFIEIIIFINYFTINKINNLRSREIIVHNNYKVPVIGLVSNNSYKLLINSVNNTDYNIISYYKKRGLNNDPISNLYLGNNIIVFEGKKILTIDKKNENKILLNKNNFKIDYVVVSNNAKINIDSIKKHFNPLKIIIDSTNNYKTIKHLEKVCSENYYLCYFTKNQGDFVVKI